MLVQNFLKIFRKMTVSKLFLVNFKLAILIEKSLENVEDSLCLSL